MVISKSRIATAISIIGFLISQVILLVLLGKFMSQWVIKIFTSGNAADHLIRTTWWATIETSGAIVLVYNAVIVVAVAITVGLHRDR